MRVGAITRHATEPHFYGWTWSPVGVATEYVKDAIAVRDYETVELPSLTERKTVLLHGFPFEEALTSGGAADLPEAMAGKVRDLDYKTLRHPGHYEWVAGVLADLPEGDDRPARLQDAMEAAIPHVEDDLVVVYASVEGRDMIIDDVITAGTAIREVMQIIDNLGAQVQAVTIALDRQERGQGSRSAIQELEDTGIEVVSIVKLDHIVEYLKNNRQTDQVDAIERYRAEYGCD